MCTVIVASYPGTKIPLIIGANRDEREDRPSLGFQWYGPIFRPTDLVFHGTWIGVNRDGIFAAITNWDIDYDTGKKFKSRGCIVEELLELTNTSQVYDKLWHLKAGPYKPFNVIAGNRDSVFVLKAASDTDRVVEKLDAGLHISAGWGFDDPVWDTRRGQNIIDIFSSYTIDFNQPIKPHMMVSAMKLHDYGLEECDVCVHDQATTHRTVSSCIMEFYNTGDVKVKHLEGKPCKGVYAECKF